MAEQATSHPPQTGLAIVREIERIAIKVQTHPITELEIELLMAHMPGLLSEYRVLRETLSPATGQTTCDARQPEIAAPQPRLHLVKTEEARP